MPFNVMEAESNDLKPSMELVIRLPLSYLPGNENSIAKACKADNGRVKFATKPYLLQKCGGEFIFLGKANSSTIWLQRA